MHKGQLTNKQIAMVRKELDSDVDMQIEAYNRNKDGYADRLKELLFIENEEDARQYFKDMKRDNKLILSGLKKASKTESLFDLASLKAKGLIDYKVTCITPTSKGELFDLCYFYSDALKTEINMLLDICGVLKVNEMEFEDIVFYRDSVENKDILAKIISHEKHVEVFLNKDEINEFLLSVVN